MTKKKLNPRYQRKRITPTARGRFRCLGTERLFDALADLLQLVIGVDIAVAALLGVQHLARVGQRHFEVSRHIGRSLATHDDFVSEPLLQVQLELVELGAVASGAAERDWKGDHRQSAMNKVSNLPIKYVNLECHFGEIRMTVTTQTQVENGTWMIC
jgi:hypothetical protein